MSPEEKRLRQFGYILVGFLLTAGSLSFFKHKNPFSPFFLICFGLAPFTLLTTLVWTKALVPVEKIFIHLGTVLGFISTRIVLGLIFFLILTPLGIFFKLAGRKSLFPKIDRNSVSYWENSANSPPDRFQRQF